MTIKESVKEVLESLPDDTTLDEIIHALYLKAKFERGEAEIRGGRGRTHDEAREQLRKWAG